MFWANRTVWASGLATVMGVALLLVVDLRDGVQHSRVVLPAKSAADLW